MTPLPGGPPDTYPIRPNLLVCVHVCFFFAACHFVPAPVCHAVASLFLCHGWLPACLPVCLPACQVPMLAGYMDKFEEQLRLRMPKLAAHFEVIPGPRYRTGNHVSPLHEERFISL